MTSNALRLRLIALKLPRLLAQTMIISLLCAAVMTYMIRVGSNFTENLVFSNCIGMTAMALINISRFFFWHKNKSHKFGVLLISILIAPLSFFAGSLIAIYLLGLPLTILTLTLSKNTIGSIMLTLLVSVGVI